MNLTLSRSDMIRGAIIYSIGDTIAQLIVHNFSYTRLLGIIFLGGIVYAFEIPNYLYWLNKKFSDNKFSTKILAAVLFTLYFNPFWIARHILVLDFFQGSWGQINWHLLQIGWESFIYSVIFVVPFNYLIANVIPYRWRFISTGVFSGIMAIYYALSAVWFN